LGFFAAHCAAFRKNLGLLPQTGILLWITALLIATYIDKKRKSVLRKNWYYNIGIKKFLIGITNDITRRLYLVVIE
jgi:hypothetical protein